MAGLLLIMGIDCGKEGAIAIYNSVSKAYRVLPTPVIIETYKGKKRVGYNITKMTELIPRSNTMIIIEETFGLPKNGMSNWATGYTYGLWQGILVGKGIPTSRIKIVKPKEWQAKMLINHPGKNTKERSIARVQAVHPEINLRRTMKSKTNDNNFADAVNILDYGLQILLKEGIKL